MLKNDQRTSALQARALEHQLEAIHLEEERQAEFNDRMRRQR